MEKAISEKTLALSNLSRKPYRTTSLAALVAISSFVLFGSLVLASSLKSGIAGLRSRLGADLLVVPKGYERGAESVLLSGEPNYFYMDKSVLETVRNVEGVQKASGQFYLTSLSESCCDFPIQLIGFDPETDFTVQTWAKNRISNDFAKKTGEEFLLAGCNIISEHNSVKFFGSSHKITGKLSKSGSGMDSVIFCDLETLQNIFEDAKARGFGFISDGDTKNKVSTVLVKITENASADSVALRIKEAAGDVQVIQGEKFMRNVSSKLSSFLIFLYASSILVLFITVLSLSLVFSLTINERRREFSILRVLGANRSSLRNIIFCEAGILGLSGSLTGIFLSALVILPFNALISEKIALPFAMSGWGEITVFALLVLIVSQVSCVLSAVGASVRVSKIEPYGDVK